MVPMGKIPVDAGALAKSEMKRSGGSVTTIDDQLTPCDKFSLIRYQVQYAVGDVVRLADVAYGMFGVKLLFQLLTAQPDFTHWSLRKFSTRGVQMNPGWTELTRMLSLA